MTGSRNDEPLPWADDDDGEEYAVLPPDPEVLEGERRRRDAQIAELEAKAAAEPSLNDDVWNVDFKFRFRFGIRDLLAGMAIVAVAFTCAKLLDPCTGFSVAILSTLVWMQYRLVCAERDQANTKQTVSQRRTTQTPKSSWRDHVRALCSYSVADLLIAITVAAFVFAMLGWVGPAYTTALLGMAVTAGIVAYLLDFRPPRQWWLVWALVCFSYIAFAITLAIRKWLSP